MAAHQHNFRCILKPGNDFQFVSKFRLWIAISVTLCAASIALLFVNKAFRGSHLNWTIDFKGGTDVQVNLGATPKVKADDIRSAMQTANYAGAEVANFGDQPNSFLIRLATIPFLAPDREAALKHAFVAKFGGPPDTPPFPHQAGFLVRQQ